MQPEHLPPGKLVRFDELEPGMHIMSPNGPVEIMNAYDTHIPEKMYEILLEGAETPLKASGNHLWYVVTQNDVSMHSMRLKQGKKALQNLDADMIYTLEETAYDTTHNILETSLADMVSLVGGMENTEKKTTLTRIAQSIGHIAENRAVIHDDSATEGYRTTVLRMYDAVVFAQQILALTGKRKYKKQWPIKVGRVITTEDLVNIYDTAELPVIEML